MMTTNKMLRIVRICASLCFFCFTFGENSGAAVPETITIQGSLEDSGGGPVAGVHDYRVGFYDDEIGGSEIAFVTGAVVLSDAGRFSIEAHLPEAVLEATDVWHQLAIDFEDDGIDLSDFFQSRAKIQSVPFALLAKNANDSARLGGLLPADYTTDMELASGLAGRAASIHNHLGQTWIGDRNPLTIRGNFPDQSPIIPIPLKSKGLGGFQKIPKAPLILENTDEEAADLLLLGTQATIATVDETSSDLVLKANGEVSVILDADDNDSAQLFGIKNSNRNTVFGINDAGNWFFLGQLIEKSDHPLDPEIKTLSHVQVKSSDRLNLYRGNVVLDEAGEGWVELPDYFEAYNSDFTYQLTPIGAPAPGLYVAETIENNRFKIAGGEPNQQVSWQVTGVRGDAFAKAYPVVPEQEKRPEEKGKYLRPELYGESKEKQLSVDLSE